MHKGYHEEDIDRYILGRMYGVELSSFEKAMRDNPELYQEVVLMKEIKSSLERRARNVEQIKEWKRYEIQRRHVACGEYSYMPAPSCESQQAPSEPKRGLRKWIIIGCVVVSVLIGILFIYPYTYRGLQDYSLVASIEESELVYALWKDRNYEQALQLIDEALSENNESWDVMIPPDNRAYELGWLRVQTLLKNRNYFEARSAAFPYMYWSGAYQKEAKRLYRKLNVILRVTF